MELILDSKAVLGEGPVWDPTLKKLYWVDILSKEIHLFDPSSRTDEVLKQLEQNIGALVPCQTGGLILALQDGFYHLNLDSDELRLLSLVEKDLPNNRLNDGKCDSLGRFWAGTMDMNESEPLGSLYCFASPENVWKMYSGVTVSNGLGWSPDNKYMYYNDSPTRRVLRFDFRIDSAQISNPTVVVELPNGDGYPDGLTVDAEGMLWIAHWGGSKVSRWDPSTGLELDEFALPCSQVTSCTFGGEQLDELYVTTARVGLSEESLRREPLAGGLFRVKTNYKGLPANFQKQLKHTF